MLEMIRVLLYINIEVKGLNYEVHRFDYRHVFLLIKSFMQYPSGGQGGAVYLWLLLYIYLSLRERREGVLRETWGNIQKVRIILQSPLNICDIWK